ncbi:MAG: flagellar hook-associated protein FlgK [Campylobacterales bacterium]|nr:flagellar hook-associated protein FlgK [Campylobacterales bacterium]
MSLFSTLNTGVSGLNTSSLSIATSSHNIANVNNPHYTRQRVITSASIPLSTVPGDVGTGVKVDTIARIHDEFLYTRLKQSSNMLSYTSYSQQRLQEVARYFPDLNDVGIQKDIKNYYKAWNDFASNPSEGAQKINLIQNAKTMVSNIQNTRNQVRTLQDSVNDELKTNVDELNRIGEQIAKINGEIGRVESLNQNRANDLRDQRDQLEQTMAGLVDFSVFKGTMVTENVIDANLTDQGKDYHLNIAGFSFVDGPTFHPIVIDNAKNGSAYYSIYHEQQDGRRVEMTGLLQGGKMGAMLDLRGRIIEPDGNGYPKDGTLQEYVDDLDSFAKTLIVQTNNLYAQSAQARMESSSMRGLTPTTPLMNFDSSFQRGSFDVVIYDAQGKEVARKNVEINALTTMDDGSAQSVVGQFNRNSDDNQDNDATNDVDDYFFANYNYDPETKQGSLSFAPTDAQAGYTIAVEDKGSNFAGVVGMSRFFEGDSAANIKVDSALITDPSKLQGFNAPVDGNNTLANAMVQMQYDKLSFYRSNGTVASETVESFYRFVTVKVASDTESVGRSNDTNKALYNTIYSEYQSVSGVSLDEELISLMKFQTAYSANAKVITAIDQMLDVLLGIK